MSEWTRARGFRARALCGVCQAEGPMFVCDGVTSRDPWRLCLKPLCGACRVAHAAYDYCKSCAVARGYATREVGEEG